MLTMGQFSKVLLTIDNALYTVPYRALDCGPGLDELIKQEHF